MAKEPSETKAAMKGSAFPRASCIVPDWPHSLRDRQLRTLPPRPRPRPRSRPRSGPRPGPSSSLRRYPGTTRRRRTKTKSLALMLTLAYPWLLLLLPLLLLVRWLVPPHREPRQGTSRSISSAASRAEPTKSRGRRSGIARGLAARDQPRLCMGLCRACSLGRNGSNHP